MTRDPITGRYVADPPLVEFMARVDRTGGDDACWLWVGNMLKKGYGRFQLNGHTERAHRAAWLLLRGPIPDGLRVCHSCDNPRCVNPEHLWLGTDLDNQRDKKQKNRGRYHRGEQNGFAKLTVEQVKYIRRVYTRGQFGGGRQPRSETSQSGLARRFGVDRLAIRAIINGRTWKHVT